MREGGRERGASSKQGEDEKAKTHEIGRTVRVSHRIKHLRTLSGKMMPSGSTCAPARFKTSIFIPGILQTKCVILRRLLRCFQLSLSFHFYTYFYSRRSSWRQIIIIDIERFSSSSVLSFLLFDVSQKPSPGHIY